MAPKPVIVIGAGGHASVVGATLVAAGYRVAAYYDDDESKWGKRVGGVAIVGAIEEAARATVSRAVVGIGDNRTRQRVAQQLGLDWVTVVHPFTSIAPGVTFGVGTVAFAGTIIQPGSTVGDHVILNSRAGVDHDVVVEDYVHVATAHLAGGTLAEEGSFLGLFSTILPGLRVGAWATVGAGSLVRTDVRPGTTVFGNPAREIMAPSPRSSGSPPGP
jgi:acetyltransferase EpsM